MSEIRIQLDISSDKMKELEALMMKTGVRTRKDLLNNALTLLEWAIEERGKGRIIASLDETNKSYKERV